MVSKRKSKSPNPEEIKDLDLPPPVAKAIARAGGYQQVVSAIPDSRGLDRTARTYLVLSDPTRIRILFALSVSDLCPCVLKRLAGMSDSKLSYHLSKLESAGLVSSRKTQNWRVYSITEKGRRLLD